MQMFWRLVHHLPWSVSRVVCDMCREFGTDPKKLADRLGQEVEAVGPPGRRVVGWSCDHMSLTTFGAYVSTVNTWCGCDMEPIYDDEPATHGGSTTVTL